VVAVTFLVRLRRPGSGGVASGVKLELRILAGGSCCGQGKSEEGATHAFFNNTSSCDGCHIFTCFVSCWIEGGGSLALRSMSGLTVTNVHLFSSSSLSLLFAAGRIT
jgi:hypothetical protein